MGGRAVARLQGGRHRRFRDHHPGGEETPAVLVQCRTSDDERARRLRDKIRERVRAITGMNCVIELVPPRTLPRPARANFSRAKARNLYLVRRDPALRYRGVSASFYRAAEKAFRDGRDNVTLRVTASLNPVACRVATINATTEQRLPKLDWRVVCNRAVHPGSGGGDAARGAAQARCGPAMAVAAWGQAFDALAHRATCWSARRRRSALGLWLFASRC